MPPFGSDGSLLETLLYAGHFVWNMPADGMVVEAAPAWHAYTGQGAEAARGQGWLEAVHPDDRECASTVLAHALEARQPFALECRLRRSDGVYLWFLVQGGPILDADGGIREWVGSCTDLTERKRQERELEALQALTDTSLDHLDLDALLRRLLEVVCDVMQVDNAAILLMDEAGQNLVVRAARGPEERVAEQVRVPVGQGFAGRVASSGAPLVVDDLSTFDVVNPLLRESLHSALGVPLLVEGRTLGVVHVGSARPHHFAAPDVRLLERVAARIALAVDRAQAHDLARERAAQLEAVIESVPTPLSIHDAQGRLMHLNRAGREHVTTEATGPVGLDLAELPEAFALRTTEGIPLPLAEQPVARALRGEHVTDVELRRTRPNGEQIDALISASPLRDAHGQVTGVVTVSRDISALRRAERQAEQRASTLQATFDAMTDAIVLYDGEGRVVYLNAAGHALFDQVLGPGHHELPARERSGLYALRDARGAPFPPGRRPVDRLLRGEVLKGPEAVDALLARADGGEVFVSIGGAPIRGTDGGVLGAVAVARDMTERQQLERRTRESLDALLEMARTLVEPDAQGAAEGTTEASGASEAAEAPLTTTRTIARRLAQLTCRVLGCRRVGILAIEPETLLQRPLAVVGLAKELEPQWWAELEEHTVRYGEGADPEVLARFEAGEAVVLDMSQPPYDELPNPYGITTSLYAPMRAGARMVGILALDYGGERHIFTEDEMALAGAVAQLAALVVERERLVREREEGRARELALLTFNQRMDEFLGMAAHDLKSPVASARISAQMALRRLRRDTQQDGQGGRFPEIEHGLESVTRSMDRLARLVDRLLDVSRVRTGSLVLRPSTVDLGALVAECVEEQRALAPARDIRLELPADRVLTVEADPDRIGQVATNYLTNALRYSPEGRPILVTVREVRDHVRVAVRDEGPGIPADEQQAIWHRFERAAGVRQQTGRETGLGLGLYISREIVERHGGQVGVDSKVGCGSTFWFTLPLTRS